MVLKVDINGISRQDTLKSISAQVEHWHVAILHLEQIIHNLNADYITKFATMYSIKDIRF